MVIFTPVVSFVADEPAGYGSRDQVTIFDSSYGLFRAGGTMALVDQRLDFRSKVLPIRSAARE